ncbi:class I SAM-dependent DNA methyltransferase [Kitasatospora sp. NPDC096147]|uniref:class I SAM-dependent DNA methyltransferase n=1 Tax=Kitasatospora sp. NPDC096147 TaxID=3364093 RepID=UPI0038171E3B
MTDADFLGPTREFYDTVAEDYAEHFRDVLAARPLERALLASFAEQVGAGAVADLGCGPGEVTGYLARLGVDVFGVDLSARMVALARRTQPGVRFEQGTLTEVGRPDGSLAGVLAWYSLIHLPDEQLPFALAEFHRLLAPGGWLLIGFQTGDRPLRVAEPFGHPVALDFRRRTPERVAEAVTAAGLTVRATVRRARDETLGETAPQAFLLARRPGPGGPENPSPA